MENAKRSAVFYHEADLDGRSSGYLVCKKLQQENQAFDLFPVNYPGEVDMTAFRAGIYDEIYVVDFRLPVPVMKEMVELLGIYRIHWCDHHRTAIQEASENGLQNLPGIRNERRAGCELTWEYLFPGVDMPEFVHLLGRYDVWDHKDPRVVPFQKGLWTVPNNPADAIWETLWENRPETVEEFVKIGTVIDQSQKTSDKSYVESFSFDDVLVVGEKIFRVLVVNRGSTGSDLFVHGFDPSRHDFALGFVVTGKGIKVSLRHVNPGPNAEDLSQLAKYFGGGGHPAAAGFNASDLHFLKGLSRTLGQQ